MTIKQKSYLENDSCLVVIHEQHMSLETRKSTYDIIMRTQDLDRVWQTDQNQSVQPAAENQMH